MSVQWAADEWREIANDWQRRLKDADRLNVVQATEIQRLTEVLNTGVPILEAAANRIERLEIALKNIAATTITELDYTFEEAQRVAREALAESV